MPIEALLPGARVEVRAGDVVPADGVIAAGRSALDLSLLSGESRPMGAGPGDRVHAGTVNLSSRLEVLVEQTGEDTRVGRLMKLVEEYGRRRAPIVELADRIAGRFVAAVLVLAALTFALWARVDVGRAVDHAVALLIVTCPCALGLATPLALSAAIGQAARAGFLIKGADVIEKLTRPGRMWLDKTGTLTAGRAALLAWWGDAAAKTLAAAAEAHSSHPLARALVAALGPAPDLPVTITETHGGGIEGEVAGPRRGPGLARFREGARRRVVPPEFAGSRARALRQRAHAGAGGRGRRRGRGGRLRRSAARGRRGGARAHAPPRLARRHPLGRRPRGGRGRRAPPGPRPERLPGRRLARGQAPRGAERRRPPDRSSWSATVSTTPRRSRRATVGIAVHGGAEAALAAADVFIARPGVARVADLLDGAARAMRTVRRNLVLSLCYNAAGVALAMAGLITPVVAAVLMPLSSITVIASSYRARSFARARAPVPPCR